jgi:hypothetical protein
MPSLYILLEGNDDERFFNRVILPLLREQRYRIKIWKYAQEKRIRTIQILTSLRSMGVKCIFVRDIDEGISVDQKKKEIMDAYDHVLSGEDIAVVIMEIESWYLAGADTHVLDRLGVKEEYSTTDRITKEEFNRLIPRRMSRIVFIQEILRNYDVATAKRKNASFRYFMRHWVENGE